MRTVDETARPRAALPAKRMAAGVLLTDWEGRVLLVQPSHKPTWEIPGAAVAAGEAPRSAANRAVRDALGIEATIGSLLVLDWIPPRDERPDGVALIYDGGTLDDADARRIQLAHGELNAYGFVDLGSAVGLMASSAERRVKTALRARRLGRTIELEDGIVQIARELAADE